MSANPATDVDANGIFSAFQTETTDLPDNQESQTSGDNQESVNLETSEPTESNESESVDAPGEGNAEPDARRVKTKLGDQEVEFELVNGDIDLEQFKTGLLMKKAFYEKSEELANKRKDYESKTSELDKSLKEFRDRLDFKKELSSKEMEDLKKDDPEAYYKKKELIEEEEAVFKEWQAKRTEDLAARQAELQQEEINKLTVVIPEWLDKEVMKSETAEMSKLLLDSGFDKEQIQGIYDSRLVGLFRKAMLYEKAKSTPLQAKKKAPQKHVKSSSTTAKQKSGGKTLEEIFYGG